MGYDTRYVGELVLTGSPLTDDERAFVEDSFNDAFEDYFTVSPDGTVIACAGTLNSFDYLHLLTQLVGFLLGKQIDSDYPPFTGEQGPRTVNGVVDAEGEDFGDGWRIVVADGEVVDTRPE